MNEQEKASFSFVVGVLIHSFATPALVGYAVIYDGSLSYSILIETLAIFHVVSAIYMKEK